MKNPIKSVKIFDYNVVSSSKKDLLTFSQLHLEEGSECLNVFTPNAEQIVQAQHDPDFKRVLQIGDWLLPDGSSLILHSQCLSFLRQGLGKGGKNDNKIPERITGVDYIKNMIEWAVSHGHRVLIIGGRDYKDQRLIFNNESSQNSKKKSIEIVKVDLESNISEAREKGRVFWTPGFKKVKQRTRREMQELKQLIQKIRPSLAIFAFGAPQQEKIMYNIKEHLSSSGVLIAIAGGGSIDFLTGRIQRAPQWMQKVHLEWFFRLVQEPWRWQRQLRLIEFLFVSIADLTTKATSD